MPTSLKLPIVCRRSVFPGRASIKQAKLPAAEVNQLSQPSAAGKRRGDEEAALDDDSWAMVSACVCVCGGCGCGGGLNLGSVVSGRPLKMRAVVTAKL